MIELNLHITIKSEFAEGVASELARLGAAMSSGLGVGPQPSTAAEHPIEAAPAPAAAEAETTAATTTRRRRGPNKADAPEPQPEAAKPNGAVDRAAIVEGLTKIYSKGDPETRNRITEFRDKHGADRLRDLKDEDLPAAAQLLIALKVSEGADAV